MLKKDDKVRVVKSESEDFGKSGVVIAYAGMTIGDVQSLKEGQDITLGKGDRLYEVQLDGEKGIKQFLESDLELISTT